MIFQPYLICQFLKNALSEKSAKVKPKLIICIFIKSLFPIKENAGIGTTSALWKHIMASRNPETQANPITLALDQSIGKIRL